MTDISPQNFEFLNRDECIKIWRRRFKQLPSRHVSQRFLRRVLAYDAQCDVYGGLPADIRRILKRIAKQKPNSADKKTAQFRSVSSLSLRPGTYLVREWNGRTYQVEVLQSGFRMDGKTYRSLTAIAKTITGTQWSGPRFFGLGKS